VTLNPGETRTIVLSVSAKSLAYWDSTSHGWVVEEEPIRVRVGASSADIKGEVVVDVKR
jgi:beta-glucosidase